MRKLLCFCFFVFIAVIASPNVTESASPELQTSLFTVKYAGEITVPKGVKFEKLCNYPIVLQQGRVYKVDFHLDKCVPGDDGLTRDYWKNSDGKIVFTISTSGGNTAYMLQTGDIASSDSNSAPLVTEKDNVGKTFFGYFEEFNTSQERFLDMDKSLCIQEVSQEKEGAYIKFNMQQGIPSGYAGCGTEGHYGYSSLDGVLQVAVLNGQKCSFYKLKKTAANANASLPGMTLSDKEKARAYHYIYTADFYSILTESVKNDTDTYLLLPEAKKDKVFVLKQYGDTAPTIKVGASNVVIVTRRKITDKNVDIYFYQNDPTEPGGWIKGIQQQYIEDLPFVKTFAQKYPGDRDHVYLIGIMFNDYLEQGAKYCPTILDHVNFIPPTGDCVFANTQVGYECWSIWFKK